MGSALFSNATHALNPAQNPHSARMNMMQMAVEAMPNRTHRHPQSHREPVITNASFEVPVLNTAVFIDPRRRDHTAYFGLFDCVNDSETLERWLDQMKESLREAHMTRLIGPVGLSPFLGSGVLQDKWHLQPPMHTAYHPPYMAELMSHHFSHDLTGSVCTNSPCLKRLIWMMGWHYGRYTSTNSQPA